MIDIHTHLYFPEYDADRDETIRRAFGAGVRYMVSVGTSPEDWKQALSVAQLPMAEGRIGVAAGMHPHWFNEHVQNRELVESAIRDLRDFVGQHREQIVALGECGLDYFSRDTNPIREEQKVLQKEGFLAHISLAQEFGLPLIVHTRPSAGTMDAYEDLIDILSEVSLVHEGSATEQFFRRPDEARVPRRRMEGEKKLIPLSEPPFFILHCYMGDTEVTKEFLTLPNVYFSFTGNITYPTKKTLEGTKDDLAETVRLLPLERILVETDCPFLAPQPYRGTRNEPAYVSEVVQRLADLKEVSIDGIEKTIEETAERIFGSSRQGVLH